MFAYVGKSTSGISIVMEQIGTEVIFCSATAVIAAPTNVMKSTQHGQVQKIVFQLTSWGSAAIT